MSLVIPTPISLQSTRVMIVWLSKLPPWQPEFQPSFGSFWNSGWNLLWTKDFGNRWSNICNFRVPLHNSATFWQMLCTSLPSPHSYSLYTDKFETQEDSVNRRVECCICSKGEGARYVLFKISGTRVSLCFCLYYGRNPPLTFVSERLS